MCSYGWLCKAFLSEYERFKQCMMDRWFGSEITDRLKRSFLKV